MTTSSHPDHPLVRYREVAGLSQADLARRVGVDKSTINKIEQGSRPASPRLAVRIEAATGISRAIIRPDIFGVLPEGVSA